MNESKILLIEDEPGLILTLTDLLNSEGYEVEQASNFDDALEKALTNSYDIVLLDIMLPGGSGFDILRRMRTDQITTPVLILTARTTVPERVIGLKIGADDYLGKPFDSMELLARIEALVRRSKTTKGEPTNKLSVFRFGNVEVNFEREEVFVNNKLIQFTVQEYRLLCYLIENQGRTISRNKLLFEVWGYDQNAASRTVDVHISSLRQKLCEDPTHPRYIITVRSFGYRFEIKENS